MNAQTMLSPAETRNAPTGLSLADVLSLVEVDECRRAANHGETNQAAPAPPVAGGMRPGAAPAIDLMSLLGRCLGNIDLILRVLSSFRNAGKIDFARLEQALERADFETIVEVAHRFKGAAGNVSAPGLRKIAIALEQSGREHNGAAVEQSLNEFRVEWEEFVRCADAFAPAASVPVNGPAGKST